MSSIGPESDPITSVALALIPSTKPLGNVKIVSIKIIYSDSFGRGLAEKSPRFLYRLVRENVKIILRAM